MAMIHIDPLLRRVLLNVDMFTRYHVHSKMNPLEAKNPPTGNSSIAAENSSRVPRGPMSAMITTAT